MNKKVKNSHLVICELNDKCAYMKEPPSGHWKRMREKLREIHPEWFVPKELRHPITAFEQTPNKQIYTQIFNN